MLLFGQTRDGGPGDSSVELVWRVVKRCHNGRIYTARQRVKRERDREWERQRASGSWERESEWKEGKKREEGRGWGKRERNGRLIEVFSQLKHSSNPCHANQHNFKINPQMIYIHMSQIISMRHLQTTNMGKNPNHCLHGHTHTHRHTHRHPPTSPCGWVFHH